MNYKQKIVLMFLVWGIMMFIGSGVSLNEQPWYSILTILISGTIVFGGKKILAGLEARKKEK